MSATRKNLNQFSNDGQIECSPWETKQEDEDKDDDESPNLTLASNQELRKLSHVKDEYLLKNGDESLTIQPTTGSMLPKSLRDCQISKS